MEKISYRRTKREETDGEEAPTETDGEREAVCQHNKDGWEQ